MTQATADLKVTNMWFMLKLREHFVMLPKLSMHLVVTCISRHKWIIELPIRKGLRIFGSCVVCEPLDRYVGRHRDRHIGRGVLVEPRSICRPICRPVFRPICRPMLERYVGRYSGRHSADTLTVEYRSSVGGLSVECRWSIGRLSYNIIDINSF